MSRVAGWCFRHRVLVLVLWLVAVAALAGATRAAGKDYTDGFSLPGTDSARATQLLSAAGQRPGSGDDTIVLHTSAPGRSITEPAVREQITATLNAASRQPLVTSIRSPYAPGASAQISADGRTAYAVVGFAQPDQNLTRPDIDPLVTTVSTLRSADLQVEFGGGGFQTLKGSPVSGSVAIGLAAAAVVLFLAFGSLLATVIPLLAAILSVGAGIEIVGLLSHVLSINSITPSICALIGIGVAVDYALFVVTRFRTGLRADLDPQQATVTALATSGRAVVFAGATVAVAMLGLVLLGVDFLTGVGVAAAITVTVAVVVANTLLPALFGLLGRRVLSRRERRRSGPADESSTSRGWARWAGLVARHPVPLAAAAAMVMVVLLLPALSIRLGASDQGNDPASSTTRQAYDLLAGGFGAGYNGPLVIVGATTDPAARQAFTDLTTRLNDDPGVASATVVPPPSATVAVLTVVSRTAPQSVATTQLIDRIRDQAIPTAERGTTLRAYVGGQTAVFQDFADVLAGKLPLFLTVVILLGFLLLVVAFRSLVIPLTAALMNVLAAGAAFGVVVAVFQWGWGSNAIGLGAPGPIESFLPVMLIAILFGLSMDYQVFLVSRIREEWQRSRDTTAAVRAGQAATGRVITAAAAIMVLVFCAFVLEGRRPIGEFGLGLACAILIDALVLRTVLVPAVMQLLGRWNWWLPGWLDRILPGREVPIDSSETRPERFGEYEPAAGHAG